jgi:ribonuclease HIII
MTLENTALIKIKELKKNADKAGIKTDELETKEFNHEFICVDGKDKVKVQIYFGKKGIKIILQGDRQSEFYKRVTNIIQDQQSLLLENQKLDEPDQYIGSDEAGKGDFFGPLVVAAVFVDEKTKKELMKSGVRDSKDISDSQIRIMSDEIKMIVKNKFDIVQINPSKYNELYDRFKNLNKLLNWAHSTVIQNLLEKTDAKSVITDQFSRKELDIVSKTKFSDVEFIQETKAEKFIGVAAASILARNFFLHWFDQTRKKGLDFPKGSSLETDQFLQKFLKSNSIEELNEYAKLHFKTLKKIK